MNIVDGAGRPVDGGELEEGIKDGYRVVLLMSRDAQEFEIGGNTMPNLELMLDMLARATRFLDAQYRIQVALKANSAVKQHNLDMRWAQEAIKKH